MPNINLRKVDSTNILRLAEPAPPHLTQRINIQGIPGGVPEMVAVFNACLQVDRLQRASEVLKRFVRIGTLAPDEIVELHNRYLYARLAQISADPGLDKAEDIHKWFELEILKVELPYTPETIACMLKASLLTSHGDQLSRFVARYMGMLPQQSALEAIFYTDVLSPDDLATIVRICPSYNMPDHLPEYEPDTPVDASTTSTTGAETLQEAPISSEPSSAFPEVRPTPQKGVGLDVIKYTLRLLNEIPEGCDVATLPYADRREIQNQVEKSSVEAAISRWRSEYQKLKDLGRNPAFQSESLAAIMYHWHTTLEEYIKEELRLLDASEDSPSKSPEDLDRCAYGPFMRQVAPHRLAALTILAVIDMFQQDKSGERGVPTTRTCNHIGKLVEDDFRLQRKDKLGTLPKFKQKSEPRRFRMRPGQLTPQPTPTPTNTGADEAGALHLDGPIISEPSAIEDTEWPLSIKLQLGAALLSGLLKTSRMTVIKEHPETKQKASQSQPVFSHSSRLSRGKKLGIILPNPELIKHLKREPMADMIARHLPMVCPPDPWTGLKVGGYVKYPVSIVRTTVGEVEQRIYADAAIIRGDMEQVLKGLDVLGKTAWKVNHSVLDVMLKVWNSGEPLGKIPPATFDPELPPEPPAEAGKDAKVKWKARLKALENLKTGYHSQRCYINLQLEIARAFRDQTFYFPHNVDFRGRAYPVPPYLNHMGADHVRALLYFAKGKPLGANGLGWLKIHLANVYGYDKASLKDREQFAIDNYDNVIDSAENPLTGKKWWQQAEDPWQCLATCYELKAALESPDPTQFVSHLPIHQDGTCNGLQHYAALGGDAWGASQVNLVPQDKPADVYSAVADLVKELIAKDLEEGDHMAEACTGKIVRKVVKQTVMTNVYGVTFVGAKDQIRKQLDALYPRFEAETGIPSYMAAMYIAAKVFKALGTMFQGAHHIQDWLVDAADRVCRALTMEQLDKIAALAPPELAFPQQKDEEKATRGKKAHLKTAFSEDIMDHFRSTIVWTTPLGMPVVQPYRKSLMKKITTNIQDLTVKVPGRQQPVDKRKQLQAFPPNFVHSLDASHMLLSALECDAAGLTFAAVHDSFWTHAADVDKMNIILRDAFIRIHSEDVIGRLGEEFNTRYQNAIYLASIRATTPAAKLIDQFRKEHNWSSLQELLVEKRRQELLRSSDPKEVEEGRAIVTPASIYETAGGDKDLEASEDREKVMKSDIPETSEDLARAIAKEQKAMLAKEEGEMVADDVDGEEMAAETPGPDDETAGLDEATEAKTSTNWINKLKVTKTNKPGYKTPRVVKFWLPLKFPPLPKKGDFDVEALRQSAYFFS